MGQIRSIIPTPLAVFVRERLAELEISQSDFCRRSTFDQGLLSKIQNSLITSLSIESVLKLAVGLSVPPHKLFQLIDRMDLHDLVVRSYGPEISSFLSSWLKGQSPELAVEMEKLISEVSTTSNGSVHPVVRTRRRRWIGEDPDLANAGSVDGGEEKLEL